MNKFFWHNLKLEEIANILRANLKEGLTVKEAEVHLQEFGQNKLPEEKPLSGLKIFLEQFKSPLIYILLVAGSLALLLKEYTDAIVVFGAVFLNTIVGFFQENKASQTLQKLKQAVKHQTEVLREGKLIIIDSGQVVVGDIVVLNPGDIVSADARIIKSQNLRINEMALTGEWLSAEKKQSILPKETPLADRDNMVYMGTVVEDGKAKVIVVATGLETEIGQISSMIKESKEEKTPYQKKLANFSKIVGIVITVICFVIFIEGILKGRDFEEMFITSVAVAVAAIPEGLSVAMSVILALGMQRILEKGGLVRKMVSAETLGSTTVICTDKTGTLTEGKMEVERVISPDLILNNKEDEKTDRLSLKIAALTSEAFIENPQSDKKEWIVRGRPTDQALLKAALERNIIDISGNEKTEKIAELLFNTINKFIAIVLKENKDNFLYVCGAPERVIERCSFIRSNGQDIKINQQDLDKINNDLKKLAQKGLRVVATAMKPILSNQEKLFLTDQDFSKHISEIVFTGFITLKDPLRQDAKESIALCKQAGMRIIIATGDHKLTARAVAEELGFEIDEENILEGGELNQLSDHEYDKILEKIDIYARVEPKHKTRIIEAWQKRGEVVAMTGDGINDAPALKAADIGVALGSGTEVAKETSDLILLNNSFSIIVSAIEEGRAILDNIRKVITYLLSDSFTEVLLISISILAGLPLPITAVQILWVNLIEDGLPGIALAFEKKEEGLMSAKPSGRQIHLLTREMKIIIFAVGILTDLILVGIFLWLLNIDKSEVHIRTMIFASLTIDSLFYAFACKSLKRNLWHINPFSNKLLVFSLIVGISFLLMAIYLPFLQNLLKTVPLNWHDWLIIISLGLVELILVEAVKWHFIVKKDFV